MSEWNEWRKANPKIEIYLQNADLKAMYLEGVSLTEAYLDGSNLLEARLEDAQFNGAHLENTIFKGAFFSKKTNITNAHLDGSDLLDFINEFKRLPVCNYKQFKILQYFSNIEDMSGWNKWREKNSKIKIYFQHANLKNLFLKGASLRDADLQMADLVSADLQNTDLANADLRNANLVNAYLKNAYLVNTDLENADLMFANLENANLMFANLENANLENAYLKNAYLVMADFKYADLKNTNLEKANLENAYLVMADFENANLKKANLENADLMFANLENANLQLTCLKKANLKQAKLIGTKLKQTNFKDATLWHADLQGASFYKSNLKGAIFRCIIVNGSTIIHHSFIDETTDFTTVALDSARIEPSLLAALKTNIRRIAWNKYYDEQRKLFWGKIKTAPIRLFWWLSDYGSSSERIFLSILISILLFTNAYLIIGSYAPNVISLPEQRAIATPDIVPISDSYIRVICFAISTMVTLGFGGINVTIDKAFPKLSNVAFLAVTFNLVLGYLFLSVLVTRFGILFQSQAPEQKAKETNNTLLYFVALILLALSPYMLFCWEDIIGFINYAALITVLFGMGYFHFK
ncbi:MAG: pentapeptide repeat-containing protein [Paludibacter sp.]|nr:pentapeptide repeat-containing protein [Paludibacter sp.]